MLAVLQHRGPDDEGLEEFVVGELHVLLGSRRLAIIDLSPAGHQPIFNEDRTVAVVLNGEIYNFEILREDLARRGHRFISRTDSEVIAHGYEEYQTGIFRLLDGMFAVAIWDRNAKRLILARDRFGKKPLYFYSDDNTVVFGSEIKAVIMHPSVPLELDPAVVPEYLVHGYVQDEQTFFRPIRQVPAASWLEFRPDASPRRVTYWHLQFPAVGEERDMPEAEAAEAVRGLLLEAVRRRLVSDVPVGALLSGGIDSSAVVRLMADVGRGPVRTFTAGFNDGAGYDERPFALSVATSIGTSHTELAVNSGNAAELVDRLLWHHDQPYGDSSAIPTYLISGATRQSVTVALVGDGGDETFAGYDRFRAALLAERVPEVAAAPVGALLRRLPAGRGYHSRLTRLRRFGRGIGVPLARRYLEWVSVVPPASASQLLTPDLARLLPSVEARIDAILEEAKTSHPLHRLMHLNLRTYLPGDLLIKMDRMSMAQSLETRSPFLDTALVEFVASLPATQHIRGGRQKMLLRRAFAHHLPSSILRRGKHGFGVPVDAWFRGSLRTRLMDELLARDARIAGFLRMEEVRRLVEAHLSGRGNHGPCLWALLNLEVWLRQYRTWPRQAGRHV